MLTTNEVGQNGQPREVVSLVNMILILNQQISLKIGNRKIGQLREVVNLGSCTVYVYEVSSFCTKYLS